MKGATRTYKLKEIHAVSNQIFDHGNLKAATPFTGRTFAYCRTIAVSLVRNLRWEELPVTDLNTYLTENQINFLKDIAYTLRVARNDDTCRGYRCSENSLTAGGYCGLHDSYDF